MARVTFVKKAQQRYETKPVLNEDGTQKRTPVMKRDGTQKTSKRGPVFLRVTEADKSRPKAPLSCDFSGCQIHGGKILPGDAYKHITPKSGPYGGWQKNRHTEHPSWQVWEYSSSLSARIAQIQNDVDFGLVDSPDEVREVLGNMAEEIRSLAEEKREGASNIEDGFGHSTYQSEELEQTADDLDSWADDVEGAEVPELEDFPNEDLDEQGDDETDEEYADRVDALDETERYDVDAWRDAVNDISEPFDSPF